MNNLDFSNKKGCLRLKKSLSKNYIYNLIYQIITIIVPIILIPYTTQTLLKTATGVYSYTHSIVLYFTYFAMLGVTYYGNKKISINTDNIESLNNTFWGIFIFKGIISIIALIGYFVLILLLDNEYRTIYVVQSLFIISCLFDISWFFTGIEDIKPLVFRNLVVKIIALLLIFILVKKPEDLWIYAIILGSSELIGHLFTWLSLSKYQIKFKPSRLKDYEIFSHSKGMIILFIPKLVVQVYTTMNNTMLGLLSTVEEVALFDYANKIVNILITLVTAVGIVMLPRISSLNSKGNNKEILYYLDKTTTLMVYLGIPIMFGTMAIGQSVIPWFLGSEFIYTGILLLFLPLKIIIVLISNVIGIQYLIPKEKNKEFIISSIGGAISALLMNFILIPVLGSLGAVISILFAEATVAFIQWKYVHKEFDVFKSIVKMWRVFIASIIMFCSTHLMVLYTSQGITSFFNELINSEKLAQIFTSLFIIVVNMILYGVLILILKEPLNKYILNKILKRRGLD